MRGCAYKLATVFVALVCSPLLSRAEDIKPAQEKLVGTWAGKVQIDRDQLKMNPIVGDDLSDAKIQGIALALGLLAAVKRQTLTFEKDGTAINALARGSDRQEQKGTWELVEAQGDRLSVRFIHDKQVTSMEFRRIDDDHLELVLPGILTRGITHRFSRQKPPEK